MHANLSRLTRTERTGSRIGLLSSCSPVCNPAHHSPSGRQSRRSKLRISVSMSPRPCLFLKMESGRVLPLLTCLLRNRNPRGKGKKGKAAAAGSCCRQPCQCRAPPRSNIGFRSLTLSLRFQRWFRLMFLEIPVLVYVSGCAEGNAKNVTSRAVLNLGGTKQSATQVLLKQEVQVRVRKLVYERCSRASAIPLPQAAFRELLGSRSVYGPDENGK